MLAKIIYKKPWFFPILQWFFPAANWDYTVVVFGRRIYTKHKLDLALYAHEYTHCEQQKLSWVWGLVWCIRYIFSPKFRFDQELEAYQIQFQVFSTRNHDRNAQNQYLHRLAKDLSGPLYKNLIDYESARKLIREIKKL